MLSILGWLFGNGGKPQAVSSTSTPLVFVTEGGDQSAGTWRPVHEGPTGYVELQGSFKVKNTSRDLLEIVIVDVRRAGAVGGASDVRARFVPCDAGPGAPIQITFNVCSSPVFPVEDQWLLADVILSDHEGGRHKLRSMRFRRTS